MNKQRQQILETIDNINIHADLQQVMTAILQSNFPSLHNKDWAYARPNQQPQFLKNIKETIQFVAPEGKTLLVAVTPGNYKKTFEIYVKNPLDDEWYQSLDPNLSTKEKDVNYQTFRVYAITNAVITTKYGGAQQIVNAMPGQVSTGIYPATPSSYKTLSVDNMDGAMFEPSIQQELVDGIVAVFPPFRLDEYRTSSDFQVPPIARYVRLFGPGTLNEVVFTATNYCWLSYVKPNKGVRLVKQRRTYNNGVYQTTNYTLYDSNLGTGNQEIYPVNSHLNPGDVVVLATLMTAGDTMMINVHESLAQNGPTVVQIIDGATQESQIKFTVSCQVEGFVDPIQYKYGSLPYPKLLSDRIQQVTSVVYQNFKSNTPHIYNENEYYVAGAQMQNNLTQKDKYHYITGQAGLMSAIWEYLPYLLPVLEEGLSKGLGYLQNNLPKYMQSIKNYSKAGMEQSCINNDTQYDKVYFEKLQQEYDANTNNKNQTKNENKNLKKSYKSKYEDSTVIQKHFTNAKMSMTSVGDYYEEYLNQVQPQVKDLTQYDKLKYNFKHANRHKESKVFYFKVPYLYEWQGIQKVNHVYASVKSTQLNQMKHHFTVVKQMRPESQENFCFRSQSVKLDKQTMKQFAFYMKESQWHYDVQIESKNYLNMQDESWTHMLYLAMMGIQPNSPTSGQACFDRDLDGTMNVNFGDMDQVSLERKAETYKDCVFFTAKTYKNVYSQVINTQNQVHVYQIMMLKEELSEEDIGMIPANALFITANFSSRSEIAEIKRLKQAKQKKEEQVQVEKPPEIHWFDLQKNQLEKEPEGNSFYYTVPIVTEEADVVLMEIIVLVDAQVGQSDQQVTENIQFLQVNCVVEYEPYLPLLQDYKTKFVVAFRTKEQTKVQQASWTCVLMAAEQRLRVNHPITGQVELIQGAYIFGEMDEMMLWTKFDIHNNVVFFVDNENVLPDADGLKPFIVSSEDRLVYFQTYHNYYQHKNLCQIGKLKDVGDDIKVREWQIKYDELLKMYNNLQRPSNVIEKKQQLVQVDPDEKTYLVQSLLYCQKYDSTQYFKDITLILNNPAVAMAQMRMVAQADGLVQVNNPDQLHIFLQQFTQQNFSFLSESLVRDIHTISNANQTANNKLKTIAATIVKYFKVYDFEYINLDPTKVINLYALMNPNNLNRANYKKAVAELTSNNGQPRHIQGLQQAVQQTLYQRIALQNKKTMTNQEIKSMYNHLIDQIMSKPKIQIGKNKVDITSTVPQYVPPVQGQTKYTSDFQGFIAVPEKKQKKEVVIEDDDEYDDENEEVEYVIKTTKKTQNQQPRQIQKPQYQLMDVVDAGDLNI